MVSKNKSFVTGGEWKIGDAVILGEKQWKITDIRKETATLTYYDGTGQKSEQKMLVKDLGQKPMTVETPETDAKPVDKPPLPEYMAGQKLANGWVIDKPTVRGKYMVLINGSKCEMPARAILSAERDFAKREAERVVREAEEAVLHEAAEKAALAEMADMYGHAGELEKLELNPTEADGAEKEVSGIPSEEQVMAMLAKFDTLAKTIDGIAEDAKKINSLEDKLMTKIAEVTEAYDVRIREIEARLNGGATVDRGATQVTVQTFRHNLTSADDSQLEKKLNSGWRILTSTDHPAESIIRLVRETVADEVDTPEANKVVKMPGRVLFSSDQMTVVDDTEKYAHLSPMTARMAMQWDQKIDENTKRVMGDQWYEKYGHAG